MYLIEINFFRMDIQIWSIIMVSTIAIKYTRMHNSTKFVLMDFLNWPPLIIKFKLLNRFSGTKLAYVAVSEEKIIVYLSVRIFSLQILLQSQKGLLLLRLQPIFIWHWLLSTLMSVRWRAIFYSCWRWSKVRIILHRFYVY